jgi:hypothetical protein
MVEEPENLGLLAEIEILKNGSSVRNPYTKFPMPCLLGSAIRDARRVKRPRREGEEAAQEKLVVLAEMKTLKTGISSEKPLHNSPCPACLAL